MTTEKQNTSKAMRDILRLCEALQAHENVSHWAVSRRVSPKGDQIDRLLKGRDLNTRTAERLVENFSTIWPVDLEWPVDIPRPKSSPQAA